MDQFFKSLQKLGLDEDYNEGKLKKAYRTLAKSYHPDMLVSLPLEERKEKEEEFKEISEAYRYLLGRLDTNYHQNMNMGSDFFSSVDDGDIERCYIMHFFMVNFEIPNTENLTKSYMKKWLKTVIPEKSYVTLCTLAEKNELEQIIHHNSQVLKRDLSKSSVKGDSIFPIITNAVTEMLETIESLCSTNEYTYELLEKIDRISIKMVDNLYSEFRDSKFKKDCSYQYEFLSSLYDSKWEERKETIHELAFDCNFSDLLGEYRKIIVLINIQLEDILFKQLSKVKQDTKVSEKKLENDNLFLREKLNSALLKLDKLIVEAESFFQRVVNKSYFNDAYIDKEIITNKLHEINVAYLNYVEIIEREMAQRDQLLSIIDRKLDCFPYILDYDLQFQNGMKQIGTLNSEFKKKLIENLVQETSDSSVFYDSKLEEYINNPDFYPQFYGKSTLGYENSIFNCILPADCYERYVEINPRSLKKLYNSDFSMVIQNRFGSPLFLERRYQQSKTLLAFHIQDLRLADSYRVKVPEIVEINRKVYQTIFEKYIVYFKQTEQRNPDNNEVALFSELAMAMACNLEQEKIDVNTISLQTLIKLQEELRNKFFPLKTEWIDDLEQFSMSMDLNQWENYEQQIKERFQIDLFFPPIDLSYIRYGFWKSILKEDSFKIGTYYFDNRWSYENGKPISLISQRRCYLDGIGKATTGESQKKKIYV